MATVELFGRVIAAIEAVMGSRAHMDDIAIDARSLHDGMVRGLVTTREGRFIGRRSASADALRARLTNELGTEVRLDIAESRHRAPPLEPSSGVRVPKRPRQGVTSDHACRTGRS
jgi:hypothetical protein